MVTVTNVSGGDVYVSSAFKMLAASEALTFSRSAHYLSDDMQLKQLVSDGKVTLSYAAETLDSITIGTSLTGSLKLVGEAHYEAPITADSTTYVADASIANGVQTIAAQPDFPRKITMVITDANSSVTAGVVTFVGVGARGQALTQAISIANGGTHTYTTADAYAKITSITVTALAGAAGADHIKCGPSNALGLPAFNTPTPITFAVYKSNVDNANEAVGTVDAAAGTIIPTTVPNGTHTYDFFYTYVQ